VREQGSARVGSAAHLPTVHAAELNIPRYKIVVQVTIGEVKSQGVRVASRCLWDTESDNYASYSFKNVRVHACLGAWFAALSNWCRRSLVTSGVTMVCSYGVRLLHRVMCIPKQRQYI